MKLSACILTLLCVPLCTPMPTGAQTPSSPSPADGAKLMQSNNAFAVNLYGALHKRSGNLFFSPESISTAFAMAYAGAHGATATQMEKVFHFTLPPEQLGPVMGARLAVMNAPNAAYELRVADALWAQQDGKFLPAYVQQMQTSYGAGFNKVNFKAAPDAVRITINQWVEQNTNKKIQNLIPPGMLTPGTRLVLTNAIYFNGTWQNAFRNTDTQPGDFHLSAQENVKAPLMNRTGGYRYYDTGSAQVLEMPYKGDTLSMVVMLPKDVAGLTALEGAFTPTALNTWLNGLKPADKVILTLPRFTMTQTFELSNTLKAMGMPLAFSSAADFSGMTGKPEFFISAAIHKAFVDVNEQGTEAAAATAVTMTTMAMRRPTPEPPPVIFRADHPFLFLIRDTKTGAILFLGRVTNPMK